MVDRIKWQLQPWHRDYIEVAMRKIHESLESAGWEGLERIRDDLRDIEIELFSLLPEVHFGKPQETFMHPSGFEWSPLWKRDPRPIEKLMEALEGYSVDYLYLRLDHDPAYREDC